MSRDFFDMSSKQSMVMGLAVGVAAISSIGFLALLFDGGSAGLSSGTVAGTTNLVNTNTAAPAPSAPAPSGGNLAAVSPVTDADHIRGNKNAKVTLIEYSDFECPFCKRHKPTLDQLLSQYDGDVRLVYRHFPLTSIHPNAQKSAEASECAGEQGKFWEYHDILFDNAPALAPANLKSYAGQLGLNQSQFDSCLDGGKFASLVSKQASEAQRAGITGTPGTFVNDQLVRGAFPISQFQQIIDGLLQ